jgi:hypothetical protein
MKLPDSAALAHVKWCYYQYRAACLLFNRTPMEVGAWFCAKYIKCGIVYTIGGCGPLHTTTDPAVCWRTIGHWLRQHGYEHTAPVAVRGGGGADCYLGPDCNSGARR